MKNKKNNTISNVVNASSKCFGGAVMVATVAVTIMTVVAGDDCYVAEPGCVRACVVIAYDYEYRLKPNGSDLVLVGDSEAFGKKGTGHYGEYYRWLAGNKCTDYRNDVCPRVAQENCQPGPEE